MIPPTNPQKSSDTLRPRRPNVSEQRRTDRLADARPDAPLCSGQEHDVLQRATLLAPRSEVHTLVRAGERYVQRDPFRGGAQPVARDGAWGVWGRPCENFATGKEGGWGGRRRAQCGGREGKGWGRRAGGRWW